MLGSAHLPTMAARLADMLARRRSCADRTMVLVLGGLMVMVGLAFKLSAVPFHFWAPDVFEGATAEVGRVPVGRLEGRRAGPSGPAGDRLRIRAATRPSSRRSRPRGNTWPCSIGTAGRGHLHVRQPGRLRPDEHEAAAGLFDDRARRLHDDARGRRRSLLGGDAAAARSAAGALAFYVAIYLFMNLGAFAVVAFLRNATGSEEIADYAGLIRRSPASPSACRSSCSAWSACRRWPASPPSSPSSPACSTPACWPCWPSAAEHGPESVLLPPRRQGDGVRRGGGRFRRDGDGVVDGTVLSRRDGAAGGVGHLVERTAYVGRSGCGGTVLKEWR